ncbi:MAG: IS200/IS605 family transposase [Pirellulaceae bacterium]|nr:IS200/IS605 family transposase [Pirellulaceae bacterium]
MAQSLHVVGVHLVFGTRCRRPMLDSTVRPGLFNYVAGVLHNLECRAVTVGGVEDHVHVACLLTKKHATMTVVEEVKRSSSKWLKTQSPRLRSFYWQNGYGLFSVSPSHMEPLRSYIANQETHHRRETFSDEFIRLLKKYGAEYDERYLWD